VAYFFRATLYSFVFVCSVVCVFADDSTNELHVFISPLKIQPTGNELAGSFDRPTHSFRQLSGPCTKLRLHESSR